MRLALALSMAGLLAGVSIWRGPAAGGGPGTVAHACRDGPHRQGLPVQQGGRRRVSRHRHRRAPGRRQLRRDRQRRGRDDRGRPRVARGRLGAAGRGEGADAQAGALRGQHALPLRPRARQPGVRAERGDHRPRVHAADAHRRQVRGDAALPELPERAPWHRSRACASASPPRRRPRPRPSCRPSSRRRNRTRPRRRSCEPCRRT